MSHHFDYTADERLDISDAYCFAGAIDGRGPRTVFGMNASPGCRHALGHPAGYYKLKLADDEDYVEDITWRFTFPVDSAGTQHVEVAELTGREAADRGAKAGSSRPRRARGGGTRTGPRDQIFAGKRRDPFFNYIPFPLAVTAALAKGVFPDLAALFPRTTIS